MRLQSSSINHKLQITSRQCISKSTPQFPFHCCSTLTDQQHAASNISLNIDYDRPRCREHLAFNSATTSTTSVPSSGAFAFSSRPAVSLGTRWMDIQGFKNWEGLLDPLDNNLRGEIIRYGHFVEAAYRSCDFEPSSSSYAQCTHSKRKLLVLSGFPETGYRVTKNLNATSGIQLPRWVEKAPNWMAMRSSWIGYVAVCQDKRVISKLGRRDVVIALRGTATCLEWLENLRATLTPIANNDHAAGSNKLSDANDSFPMVESGFLSLYTSRMGASQSLQDSLRQEIERILAIYGDKPLSFTITGHSLGAALATLAAYDIKETFKCEHLVTVISFGGPRVGNHSFRCRLEEQGTKILRIVNSDDLITKVPGFVIDNNDDDGLAKDNEPATTTATKVGNLTSWIQKVVEDSQWVYADVGCELRLSSRDSPHLNGVDFATCHELKTYLHLVDEFVSSNCPFRATARKIMKNSRASLI